MNQAFIVYVSVIHHFCFYGALLISRVLFVNKYLFSSVLRCSFFGAFYLCFFLYSISLCCSSFENETNISYSIFNHRFLFDIEEKSNKFVFRVYLCNSMIVDFLMKGWLILLTEFYNRIKNTYSHGCTLWECDAPASCIRNLSMKRSSCF